MRLLRLQLSAQLTTNPESFIHSYSIAYYRAFYRCIWYPIGDDFGKAMAEPLSLVASLIAVVQISGSVISCCYEYRKGEKNAPKDLLRVTNEVASLRNVVDRLVALIDDEKTATHKHLSNLADMVSADGPLKLCQDELGNLKVKLEPPVSEWKALGRRLTWPMQEKDVTKTLASIYRVKTLLETALMIDNTSTIIEDVNDRLREVQNTAVLYHYFDFGNKIDSSAESFLRSLIAQLLKQTSRLPKALDQLSRGKFSDTRYRSRMAMQAESVAQPSLLELSNTLHDSMEEFDHIYIILDALDECVERQKLLPIVRRLLYSKTGKTHIFVTSRSDADLEEYLTPIATAHVLIESHLIEPDIRSYIQEQLNDNPRLRRWPKKFRERIKSALMTGAQGMFRWVACQIEVLSKCKMLKQLENALRTPPKDLTDTYRRALEELDPDSYELVCKILRLLTVSPRPIRLDEAVEFIAIDIQNGEGLVFDPDMRLLDPHDLLTMCSSLVSLSRTFIRKKDGVIVEEIMELHLAHSSVKDFLVLHFQEQVLPPVFGNIDSQAYAAECCLVYLLQFRNPWTDDHDIREFPLARYAAEFWILHMQSSKTKTSPTGNQLMLRLMDVSRMVFSNWRRLYDPDKPWRDVDLSAILCASPLYYASQSGLEHLVDQLLKKGSKPDEGNGMFGTPLQVAAYHGHLGVARMLLSAGADPNQKCGMFYTPLKAAAAGGHADLVRLLVQHGADPNVYTMTSGTALLEATKSRYPEITKILIEDAEADVNIIGSRKAASMHGTNSLEIASRNLDLDIVSQILPKASKKIISTGLASAAHTKSRELLELYAAYDPDGVLHHAAGFGWNDMVTSLLQKDAATTSTFDLGFGQEKTPSSALVAAASEGHLSIVQELISAQADVNAASDRRYALESAAGNGFGPMTSLLIKNGAQVNACGLDGTALQQASYHGDMDMVAELLDHGADPNLVDGSYGGPLQAAVIRGHHQIAQLLLNRGANIDAQPGDMCHWFGVHVSGTALAAAVHRADNDMIDFLLSKGARVDLEHNTYPPPLYVAAEAGHTALIPKLLAAGAGLEAQFGGETPLYAAVKEGHLAAARQLLDSGADANHCVFDDDSRITVLNAAVERGNDEILELLIDFGADVNAVSDLVNWPEPPLHRATEEGHLNMVRILLEHGADCNWQGNDKNGWAATHLAARGRHPEILRLLCDDYHADLSLRLSNGSLPLHSAAWKGSVECIEILLARGVDIDARNDLGRTPLHFAAEEGHVDAVEVLLKHGARVDVKEEESQMTPLDHAKMQLGKPSYSGDFQRTVEILEDKAFQFGG
ncbi:MAG: hypothetical protein ASARMPREDX12_002854 [Alectoria sarmentosa]|nr:MAG: hypothetical protein ASARMPREDX12_002854 [Alectoria sarmentosa]